MTHSLYSVRDQIANCESEVANTDFHSRIMDFMEKIHAIVELNYFKFLC